MDCLADSQSTAQKCKFLKVSYRPPGDDKTKKSKKKAPLKEHKIPTEDTSTIEEMKYYLVGDDSETNGDQVQYRQHIGRSDSTMSCFDESDQMSFLAMRIKPNKENGLDALSNSYPQSNCSTRRGSAMKYIVVEFRSDKELKVVLDAFRKVPSLAAYIDDSSSLKPEEVPQYAAALIEESKKEKKRREDSISSPRTRRKSQGTRDAENRDEVLLVYPFGASEETIEKAAVGLHEASGASLRHPESDEETRMLVSERDEQGPQLCESDARMESSGDDAPDGAANVGDGKSKGRTHVLTVRGDDRARLSPGEFLNDTLIDFWMQWYVCVFLCYDSWLLDECTLY